MEVNSLDECLNRIDDMIYDKNLKYMKKDILEEIGKYIEREDANSVAKGIYIGNGLDILIVLQQINHIIEKLYTDVDKKVLNDEFNELREKILYWYEWINRKP